MFDQNVKLSLHSNFKIGGLAKYFIETENIEKLINAIIQWQQFNQDDFFILGGGTNILFNDEEFKGLIIKPNLNFIKKEKDYIRAGASVSITQLLNYSITKNLTGLEWAAGLPGTIGGAIRGNAGAFGGEIKNNIVEVISLDTESKKIKIIKRKNKDCGFNYRSSIFKNENNKEIIIEAVLDLRKGDKKKMKEITEQNIAYRQKNQPLEYPSIGSIFKNVPIDSIRKTVSSAKLSSMPIKNDPFPLIPVAYLISEANLKGISCGGAIISPKHPNFIVNALNATANDVKNLIKLVKDRVKNKFGINLEEEIVYLK